MEGDVRADRLQHSTAADRLDAEKKRLAIAAAYNLLAKFGRGAHQRR